LVFSVSLKAESKEGFLTLGNNELGWQVYISENNGTISRYETLINGSWAPIPFRLDDKAGPSWMGIDLKLIDKNHFRFKGQQDSITYAIQYLTQDKHLVVRFEIKNNGDKIFEPFRTRAYLGVDAEMRRFPQWNDKFFPTLLRCEKTHAWGYFMSPMGRIFAFTSKEPIASYAINYINEEKLEWNWGHQIKTASLDFMHALPLPERHPHA